MKKIAPLLFSFFFFCSLCSLGYNTQRDSLLLEYKKPMADTARVKVLFQLAGLYDFNRDSVMFFGNEAAALAEKIKEDKWITMAQVLLGREYLNTSQTTDTALAIFRKLLERMKRSNYKQGIGLAYKGIGRVYIYSMVDSALFYHLKSIEMLKAINDYENLSTVQINLGIVYQQLKRYKEAIAVTQEALFYDQKNNTIGHQPAAYTNIGNYYSDLGDYNNAAINVNKALELNRKNKSVYGVANSGSILAEIYRLDKKYDEAAKISEEIIKTGLENNLSGLASTGYFGLAEISVIKKEWEQAISQINKAWKYSLKDNNTNLVRYEMLYKAYKGKQDFNKALEYHLLFIQIRDSIQVHERAKNADELEARYQNSEKQLQIDLLAKDKDLQAVEISNQRLTRNTILIVGIVLILIGFLFFNRYQLKKKIESQQAFLNERKRIGSELHDDLGAQLSTARMLLNNMINNPDGNANTKLIENSLDLIDSSINDLRKIMDELQTSTLQEKGYIAATEELVNKINSMQPIKFALTHHRIDKRFDIKVEHNLFRITQELINNTLKYAKAKNVSIDLVKRDERIVLMYEDDGTGFEIQKVKRGYGLANIESRVQSLLGTVEFDSAPAKGFRAAVEIPTDYAGEKV